MNLYLVTCNSKSLMPVSPGSNEMMVGPLDVHVLANDPTSAENAAYVEMRKLGNKIDYVSTIRLVASTQPGVGGLLVISE